MKTILVDAIGCFVTREGKIFKEMQTLLDKFPNKKIILTGANDEQMEQFGLNDMPYEVFTLKHDPEKTDPEYYKTMLEKYNLTSDDAIYFEHSKEAAKSAKSIGIETMFWDDEKKDLKALEEFLKDNL